MMAPLFMGLLCYCAGFLACYIACVIERKK